MKNKIFTIFLIVFIVFIFLLPSLLEYSYVVEDMQLNPYDYARITDVDYKAVVVDEPGSNGKVVITERLTFDVHAASPTNPFWELWRDLPEDYVDGVKVHYKVNSVKQILEDGTEIVYEESPKLYWDDSDYLSSSFSYGPGKWYHSEGPYDEENAQYECVFFYVDGLYREQVVFEIEYEMYNAALRYNDCSDLYLALYSGSTIKYLDSFKAEILFPNEDMPSAGNYDVYTYGTNANEFPITESATQNPGYYTFSFELDEEQLKFKPYNQYIEFDLVAFGEDKHIFTEYAPSNYYSSDDVLDEIYDEQQDYANAPEKYRAMKIVIFLLSVVGAVVIVVDAFTIKSQMNGKHIFYSPTMAIDYYRDIPSDLDPKFAASLVFCKDKPRKDDSGIYSAILLSLARKGYIALNDYNANDVLITLRVIMNSPLVQMPGQPTPDNPEMNAYMAAYEPLTLCEQHYYNLLVRHAAGDTILMSAFQARVSADYENTDAFVKNMNSSIVNIGVRDGYFQKADYAQPKKQLRTTSNILMTIGILLITLVNIIFYNTRIDLAFGAFFLLGICCIISSIYLKVQSKKYVLLTQFGENEYAKWRGLYNFLNSDTLINERTYIELPIWEKYLVYATAFGISEKVIQAISLRCAEVSSSPVLSNRCYRSRSFHHHTGRAFRSAVHSGSIGAHGGGSFGYGGGGRGGGGGGGGH